MNHTPGPWKSHCLDSISLFPQHVVAENGAIVARCIPTSGQVVWNVSNQEAEANARLIAAAPELLEALEQTIESLAYWFPRWGDPKGANSQMMKQAHAAIAKAKGAQ